MLSAFTKNTENILKNRYDKLMDEKEKPTPKLPALKNPPPKKHFGCLIIVGVMLVLLIIVSLHSLFGPVSDTPIPVFSPTPTDSVALSASVTSTSTKSNKTTIKSTPTTKPGANTTAPVVDNTLNFFVDLANFTQGHRNVAGISRWTGATTYIKIIEGTPTATEQTVLNQFISDFNGQSTATKLQLSTTVATNIRVFFLPGAEIQHLYGDNNVDGFTEWSSNDNCSLQEARVFITNDASNDVAYQTYVVRHELTHALGFWGHSDYYSESIMSFPRPGYNFPTIDKSAIKMLYNTGLPLCGKEAATREFFSSHPLP